MYKKLITYIILSFSFMFGVNGAQHGQPGWYGGYNHDDYFDNPSYYSNPPYSHNPINADDPYAIYGAPDSNGFYAGFEQDGAFVR